MHKIQLSYALHTISINQCKNFYWRVFMLLRARGGEIEKVQVLVPGTGTGTVPVSSQCVHLLCDSTCLQSR